jgi:small nuclear ribonucleoprotein E
MNLVVDDAVEVKLATKSEEEKRRPLGMKTHYLRFVRARDANTLSKLGQILLKGDNVSLIQAVQ